MSSATEEVVRLIERRGSATVDELLPEMPGYTREQVRRALKAANDQGLIDSDGRRRQESRPHRATGKPRGSLATVYRKKAPRQQYSRAASVWDLASLAA